MELGLATTDQIEAAAELHELNLGRALPRLTKLRAGGHNG
jgi:hypothetical protein